MNTIKNITAIQWMGIIILFNTIMIGGASQLADLALGAATIKAILAIATLGNGFLGGLTTMFGGQGNLVQTVAAMPGVERVTVNAQATSAVATVATDPSQPKVGAAASTTRAELQDIAKGAA